MSPSNTYVFPTYLTVERCPTTWFGLNLAWEKITMSLETGESPRSSLVRQTIGTQLSNTGLNCTGTLICGVFSINPVSALPLSYDF